MTEKQEIPQKTQSERFAEKLMALKPDITTEDRAAAVKEFGTTPETISRYINGKVNSIDTAFTLITFFQNRISKRDKAIA